MERSAGARIHPRPLTHPVSIKTNTGDGLKMAMRVGAMLGNMREACGCRSSKYHRTSSRWAGSC